MTRAAIILGLGLVISTSIHAQGQLPSSPGQESQSRSGERAIDVSGKWRPLKDAQIIDLQKTGESLYGERDNGKGYRVAYELTQHKDGTYSGLAAEEFSCREGHFCRTETPMQISQVGIDRIEGRIFGVNPPKGFLRGMRYCDTCGKSEEKNAAWMDFVWVRTGAEEARAKSGASD